MIPDPREQLIEAMAEARWAQMNDAPWAEAGNYARGHYIESATTQVDAALAVRVTCPTCSGQRFVRNVGEIVFSNAFTDCGTCDGDGTVPLLRMMED